MKVKQLIKENYQLQQQLDGANKQYYESLLVYIRSTNFKQEQAKEEVLLEMGQHILEAQMHAQSAEEVFGKNPKQLADDIIDNLPNETKKEIVLFGLEIVTLLFGIYVAVVGLLPLWQQESVPVSIGKGFVVAVGLLAVLVVVMLNIFRVLKKEAFSKESSKLGIKHGFVYALCLTLFMIVIFLTPTFGPTFMLPFYAPIAIGVGLLVVSFLIKGLRGK